MTKTYVKLYDRILREIDKDYIRAYHPYLSELIKTEKFKGNLKEINLARAYDAKNLMDLFYPLYKREKAIPKKDWIKDIYNWLLQLSYPARVEKSFEEGLIPLFTFYLNLLRVFCQFEKDYDQESFLYKYPISFLDEEEENESKYLEEYLNFKKAFLGSWIYELMKLDASISGHNTLDHVVGVNHLSLNIGRQLKALGLDLDLAIVAGAGLGHDIGKYGVQESESHRVPYLHYYYTEDWFKRIGAEKIGHIATNHSTWDLELENLPLESLVLIYADFRVKNRVENNEYLMHIYSLDQAYNIILNKLDNLDRKKEKRYEKVFRKLKDFEDYIVSLGVDTNLSSGLNPLVLDKPLALMEGREIVNNLKYFAIEHNIDLMAKFLDDSSFNNIIEMARSEYNWKKLRLYLQIFREYSNYLTQKQKILTLHFMVDLLFHNEEDIRKEAAEVIGLLIGKYDEEYRKEIPQSIKQANPETSSEKILDNLLRFILYPDHKIEESTIEWKYNLKTIIKSLFYETNIKNFEKYSRVLINYYGKYPDISASGQLYLAQTIKYLPIFYLNPKDLEKFQAYIFQQLDSSYLDVRLTVLDIIDEIYRELWDDEDFKIRLRNWLLGHIAPSHNTGENYLRYKLAKKLDLSQAIINKLKYNYEKDEENIQEIFLDNLKTATDWMNKKVNIDILYDQVKDSPKTAGLHTGMHFCNLLKVSAVERVRNYAGHTLLNIFQYLSLGERNEVAIELIRALEMQSYQFTKYIPDYLGQLLLYLQPGELDEIISDFDGKIKQTNSQISFLILKTTGICIEHYPKYRDRFEEKEEVYEKRLYRLLGIILNGMASYNKEIKTEAFRILASQVFNSSQLLLEEKGHIFSLISKKILTLLSQKEEDKFLFLNNSASLNHVYRFMLDYEFYQGQLEVPSRDKVAFFPGSFDPFSLSHKEIALEIRDLGFEVYLAVDEFSWSKRTQPHSFRRDIINMTIAQEKDIFLFPSERPINISNDRDLLKLQDLFGHRQVYMVIGTDVLINASAYERDGVLNQMSHIIFHRKSQQSKPNEEVLLGARFKKLKGELLFLSLPPQYEDISSTQIRDFIDLNMDISNQVDPLVQQYIYKYGLYLREPQYKSLVQRKTIETEIIQDPRKKDLDFLAQNFGEELNLPALYSLRDKIQPKILLVRDVAQKQILGFSTFYGLSSSLLFSEFRDRQVSQYLRRKSKGKLVVLSGIYTRQRDGYLIETVLNETLAHTIAKDYNYAIFKNDIYHDNQEDLEKILKVQGFFQTPFDYQGRPLFIVDMNNPMTLDQDLQYLLKPPYDSNPLIKRAIRKTRQDLKRVIAQLYPGELLLSFNEDMIYSKLIQKVCDANQVSIVQEEVRELGPNMCVPFGSILNGRILPNTVTKTMHTEKIFNPSITDFTIAAYPNYHSLDKQVKVLKSFDRPMILVDDLLHKGYRLNVIEPLIKEANIEINKVILGVLTGRGQELGLIKNLELDAAYFIPNLKLWFKESALYPFMGGDMVHREGGDYENLIASINLILPYASPSFIKGTSSKAIYSLSETCLLNAIEIFKALEQVYQEINEKSLIIGNLGQVLTSPRRPDTYKSMEHYRNQKPSTCLMGDLEHLLRIKNIIYKD